MSQVTYSVVDIINPVNRSISGRHTITESDLGLPPGTLPPEDVASIGTLITVDKEVLQPFNAIRAATKRLCDSKGVRVGMGTAVPAAELPATVGPLEKLKDEFYRTSDGTHAHDDVCALRRNTQVSVPAAALSASRHDNRQALHLAA